MLTVVQASTQASRANSYEPSPRIIGNPQFSTLLKSRFESSFLAACARRVFPRPATDMTFLDHMRLHDLPRSVSLPSETFDDLVEKLNYAGLKVEFANEIVGRWRQILPDKVVLRLARPDEIIRHVILTCKTAQGGAHHQRGWEEDVGEEQQDSSGQDDRVGPVGTGYEGSAGGGGAEKEGDPGEKEDDEPNAGQHQKKRSKGFRQLPFYNVVNHADIASFLNYQKVGSELREEHVEHAGQDVDGVWCEYVTEKRITGFYSVFHGTSPGGLRHLRRVGRWDTKKCRPSRDLSNNHGLYFASTPEYAIIHSILNSEITTASTKHENFSAIVVECFLDFNNEVIGMVKKDRMKEFYDYNHVKIPLLSNLPGVLAGGFLTEGSELTDATIGQVEGARTLIKAAFGSLQVAAVGKWSVEKLNRLGSIVRVLSPLRYHRY